jgi:hypothetical protein
VVVTGNRAGDKERKSAMKDIAQEAKSRYLASAEKLTEIAKSVDAARLFVAVLANAGFAPAEEMTESNFRDFSSKSELLAYHLYPLFGASHETRITPWKTNQCMDVLDELFRARGQYRMFSRMENGQSDVASHFADRVRMYTEMVRGSPYPEQTAEEIVSIQGKLEKWFSERAGVGAIRAQEILFAVMQAQEDAYNSSRDDFRERGKSYECLWKKARKKAPKHRSEEESRLLRFLKNAKTASIFGYVERLNEIAWDMLPVGPDDLGLLDRKPSPEEWSALCSLIGLTPETRRGMCEPVEVRHTFATMMISAGENIGWVQKMMGHSSLKMITDRYFSYVPNMTHSDRSKFMEVYSTGEKNVAQM